MNIAYLCLNLALCNSCQEYNINFIVYICVHVCVCVCVCVYIYIYICIQRYKEHFPYNLSFSIIDAF